MKRVRTWLNEKQYKTYVKRATKSGVTTYGLTKQLILQYMSRKQEEEKRLNIMFGFIIYSLAATAFILLF